MSTINLDTISQADKTNFDPFATSELKKLERKACMCKTATKVAGWICLPVSWFCYIGWHLTCIVSLADRDEHPQSGVDYSQWTTCDGKCCWLPRLPPKDRCDQVWQAFDPCICCICCDNGIATNYLSPQEQKEWIDLKKKTRVGEPGDDELERPFTHIVVPISPPRPSRIW